MSLGSAFNTLTLITLTSSSLHLFILTLPQITASFGCFDRIEKFLIHPDSSQSLAQEEKSLPSATDENQEPEKSATASRPTRNLPEMSYMLEFHQASIEKPGGYAFKEIDLKVSTGQIVAIVGPVASGKSVLLRASTGELSTSSGSILRRTHAVGFAAQTPWLRNTSIRENIVETTEFEQVWYSTVVNACALDQDFDSLSQGDETVVGTGGLMLSGGQRQRVVSLSTRKPSELNPY